MFHNLGLCNVSARLYLVWKLRRLLNRILKIVVCAQGLGKSTRSPLLLRKRLRILKLGGVRGGLKGVETWQLLLLKRLWS